MYESDNRTFVINRSAAKPAGAAGGNRPKVSETERRMRAFENGEEIAPVAQVSREFGLAISQARCAKNPKWSQKDLATRSQVPMNIISEWETGRGKPNPQYRTKLERALGVKLPAK